MTQLNEAISEAKGGNRHLSRFVSFCLLHKSLLLFPHSPLSSPPLVPLNVRTNRAESAPNADSPTDLSPSSE